MVGQRIGNYRVMRKIGEGGMGAVFEAVHEQIERRVAIKILHAKFSQEPEIAKRFINEARAVNIVQHSGLVGAYEFGALPDGAAYIVMEYLDGETLSARLKKVGGTLGLQSLNLTRQIASALAAAHRKGIIHRDLKPANVIIVPEPEAPGGERAKVLDFGIAKVTPALLADGSSGTDEVKTRTGVFMGTPKYMAPEQCRGAGTVDDKADVYSLGAMFYQMLCGRPPFDAPGEGEVMAMHIFATPRHLRDLDPSLPEGLTQMVHRMLSKKPEERPPMTQVAAELGQWAMITGMPGVGTSGVMPIVGMMPGPGMGTSGRMTLPPASAPLSTQAPATLPTMSIAPDPPSTPSTLGQAVGQTDPGKKGKRARLAILVALPALAVLGTVGALALRAPADKHAGKGAPGMPTPTPANPPRPAGPPPAPAASVRWVVTTEPAGAEVIQMGTGKVLGRTPLRLSRDAGKGSIQVILQLQGHADKVIDLDLSANDSHNEMLEPLHKPASPPAEPAQSRGGGNAHPGPGKGKHPSAHGKLPSGGDMNDDSIPLFK